MALSPYAEFAIMQPGQTNYGEGSTATISTTKFYPPAQEVQLGVNPVTDDRSDELRGVLQPLAPDVVGFGASDGTWTQRLYPNYFGLAATMNLGLPVTTAGDGIIVDPDAVVVPVGVTRHVWDSTALGSEVRAAQVIRGYPTPVGVFLKSLGVTCSELTLAAGDVNNVSTMSATLNALYTSKISDPSITPTVDATAIKPFTYGHHTIVTWLTGSAETTQITYTLSNPVDPYKSMGVTSFWYTAWDRPNDPGGAVPRLNGTLQKRYMDGDDIDAVLTNPGTSFTVKSKWNHTQNIGATSYKAGLWIEGTAQYTGMDWDSVQNRLRSGASIPFSFTTPASGSAFKITLTNGITSYSSVS